MANTIEQVIAANRASNRRSLCMFVNAGDPDLETSIGILQQCARSGVDLIELGVPFANSLTDGLTLRASHQRALVAGIEFEDVLGLVQDFKRSSSLPLVLLADFYHSVKPRGIGAVVSAAKAAGCDAMLLHGAPPLYLAEFIARCRDADVATIMTLYPTTPVEQFAFALRESRGFTYLVSRYGKTGGAVNFLDQTLADFYLRSRQQTLGYLMAGFGMKDANDVRQVLTQYPVDGVILGSSLAVLVEESLKHQSDLIAALAQFLKPLVEAMAIPYPATVQSKCPIC